MALCSLVDEAEINSSQRVGLFSYGSGCSSEFYSGVITPTSKRKLAKMRISEKLDQRHKLSMKEYEHILNLNLEWGFGIENKVLDRSEFDVIYQKQFAGKGLLTLKEIKGYHREYEWS